MLKKLIGICGVCATGASAVIVALGGATAHATTGNNTGLPEPKVEVARHIGIAFEGRFYMKRVPRSAKVLGATMDIILLTEGNPPFYFGKIQMLAYNKAGKPEISSLALWWFDYHKSTNRLTARIIPPASVTSVTPEGVPAGQISFEVPGGRTGIANNGRELETLNNAQITLNGHTFPATFERGGEPSEVITKISRAELYGP